MEEHLLKRKVEKYSSLEVPDSDNNSIKESVEFSEPSFRTNFAESLENRFELQNSHFLLEVTSSQREKISLQNALQARREDLTSEHRELISVFVFVVFCLRIWSAIYSTSGGVKMSETDRTVATVRFNRSNRSTVRGGLLTAVALGGSDPDGRAGMIRVTHTRETRFKKNRTG